MLPDAEVEAALLAEMGTGGADRLLNTNANDRARGAPSGTPSVCPVVDKVGTNGTAQAGGCDNFVLVIDGR